MAVLIGIAHPLIANPIANLLNQSVPDLVLKTIHKNINGKIQAQNVTFSPPLTLILHDPILKDQHQQTVISAKKVILNFSLLSLFIGKLKADSIIVENPHIFLITKNQELNLAQIFSKISTKKSNVSIPLIDLAQIQIQNGSLSWTEENQPRLSFEQIFGVGNIQIAPQKVRIQMASLQGKQGNLFLKENKYNIQSMSLENVFYQNKLLQIQNLKAQLADKLIKTKANYISFRLGQFSIRSQINSIEILDIPIKQANLDIEIRSKKIFFKNTTFQLEDQALVKAEGNFDLQTDQLQLETQINSLTLNTLQKVLDLDIKASALLSGHLNVSGIISADHPIQFQANANVENLISHDFRLKSSSLSLNLFLTPKKKLELQLVHLKAPGFNANLYGGIDLSRKNSLLSFDIDTQNPHLLYERVPKDIIGQGLHIAGNLKGPSSFSQIDAKFHLKNFQKGPTHGKNLSGFLKVNPQLIQLQNINGLIAMGHLYGNLVIDKSKENTLLGTFFLENASLSQIPISLSFLSRTSGDISARISLSGDWSHPKLQANTQLSNVQIKTFFFPRIDAQLVYNNNQIQITNLLAKMPYGSITSPFLFVDLTKKDWQGSFIIHEVSLTEVPRLSEHQIAGIASGSLQISNRHASPEIQGTLKLRNVSWKNQLIGDGKSFLWYRLNQSPLLQISGELIEEDAKVLYRSTIDLIHDQIRSEINLKNVSILPWTSLASSITMPLQGKISGDIQLDGSLSLPNLRANIQIPNIQYQENITTESSLTPQLEKHWTSAGPLSLYAQLKNGQIKASLCGIPQDFHSLVACSNDSRINLTTTGFFSSFHDFDLQIDGTLNLTKLEQWIRFVKKEFNSLDTSLQLKTHIVKKPSLPKLQFNGDAILQSLQISMPGLVPIALEKATKIHFHNNGITFLTPAYLSLATGRLTIQGSALTSHLNLDLNGRIPLVFSKYFVPFFSLADGLALGKLSIRGSPKYPLLDGYIIPDPGAFIKPSMILDDITFNRGQVAFKSNQQQKTLNIHFDELDMKVGDGNAHLNGNVILHQNYRPNSPQFITCNAELSGNEIVLRNQKDWVETNFHLFLQSIGKKDNLFGKVNINDGYLFKKFNFQNFILSSDQTNTLSLPEWLWPMQVNIKIDVSSFHAQTQMSAFLVDSYLTAYLDLIGTLAAPRLIGTLNITEGIFKFPLLYFEIPPTSIPFKNTPGKLIDPQIQIHAYADLPQKRFNLSSDTNIELSLTGNLEKMRLDLKTLSGDKSFDRSRLLLLLLGSSSAATEMLEKILSTYTGTQILIGSTLQSEGVATQVQWHINPRLEVEGTAKTSTKNVSFQDLKLKMMLFDHLPFAEQLFLESILFSPGTEGSDIATIKDFRLKLRVMEK